MKKPKLIQQMQDRLHPKSMMIPIKTLAKGTTRVDNFWGKHTVNSLPFKTQQESLDYLEWRFEQYPLFRELMGLWGDHTNEVVLDYGCGPGNDLTGFLMYSKAKKVIGVEVSEKALRLASRRLALHKIDQERVELVQISDAEPKIPIEDNSVDYIYCEGVLHHTSYPERILLEFYRVLKPGGSASIMVYNRNSIWLHLYTAYEKMIVQNAFPGLKLEEAFARNTDGVDCPIARCYTSAEFIDLCSAAKFRTEYLGGYLSKIEMNILKRLKHQALADDRLENVHKDFLKNLINDKKGYPMYQGKYAGIGGVYKLIK